MTTIVAQTTHGKVRGASVDGIYSFKGIPYGGGTGGERRLMPPTAPEPWAGIRDARAYGLDCPQPRGRVLNVTPRVVSVFGSGKPLPQSEACLVLNVWSPEIMDGGSRPVMVWLHGGGFFVGSGSGALYDGTALARRGDVVVVTVNHRLGPLGYLHLGDLVGPEYAASGNVGMLDLVAALEWVRDNIEAFGGDAGNVTIFGESGGGAKVSALMAMPAAEGLFHRAIIQSGPGVRMHTREKATRHARSFLRRLGISPRDIQALHDMPVEQLLAAQTAAARINRFFMLEPVVDGVILPHAPFEPEAPKVSAHVPLLIGTNKDEATLFMGNVPLLGPFSQPSALAPGLLRLVTRALAWKATPRLMRAYESAHPGASPNVLFASMMSDYTMRLGSIRLAERKVSGGGAPVYMYLFAWESPALDGKLRALHGLDLPFVFDNVGAAPGLTGDLPEAHALAAKVSAAWAAFARQGDPTIDTLAPWPSYTLEERATMILDNECRVERDPGREVRLAWEGVRVYTM